MNNRWIILLGRAGTVLMVAGLALLMLSLIPPRTVENTDFRQTLNLEPKTFTFELSFFLSIPADPQHGFNLNAEANNSVTAYLLNVGREYIQQWITSHFTDIQPSPSLNGSILQEFLSNHQASVIWQENVDDKGIELQYVPTRLMNITLVFSNQNAAAANVKYSGKLLNFIVPSERALNPAKVAIPVGFILSVPWLNFTWKRRRTVLPKNLPSPKVADHVLRESAAPRSGSRLRIGRVMIIGGIVVLALLSSGTFLLLNSLAPLEKKDTVLNDVFNVAANSYENKTAWAASSGEYIASIVVSGGTINVSWVPTVELWLDGQYKPHWTETAHTDMGFGISMGPGEKSAIYLVFLNNDTVTKEVQLEVSKVWKETNHIGLLGGAALILSGIIIVIVLVYQRRPHV
jgi:hypothetical protein